LKKKITNFMFSFVVWNVSYKNKNNGQQSKYHKMTCENMEDEIEFLYLKLILIN
jgi:fatty-acid desaturase